MLTALLSSVAHVMHKTGEAIEDAGRIVGAPEWVVGGLSAGFSALGRGAEGLANAEVGGSIIAGTGVGLNMIERAKDFFGPKAPEPAVAEKCGRSADFHMGRVQEGPLGKDGVSITEVGVMAAPPCPDFASMLKGTGLGM